MKGLNPGEFRTFGLIVPDGCYSAKICQRPIFIALHAI